MVEGLSTAPSAHGEKMSHGTVWAEAADRLAESRIEAISQVQLIRRFR